MSICEDIVNEIKKNKDVIRNFFIITPNECKDKLDKIRLINESKLEEFKEDYLTFIIACAYAYEGKKGCYSLQQILCENSLPSYSEGEDYRIYSQALPFKGTSSPKLDLAFGNINRSTGDNTKAQIVYDPPQNGSGRICFIEMKTLDDMDSSSKGNPMYNQLAKYIRAALIFQKAGRFPKTVHVSLVTPQVFRANPKSRLYGYKFMEYACPEINLDNIMADIRFPIEYEELDEEWIYTDSIGLNKRLPCLKLHWIPYEHILDNVPEGPIKKHIDDLRNKNSIFIRKGL